MKDKKNHCISKGSSRRFRNRLVGLEEIEAEGAEVDGEGLGVVEVLREVDLLGEEEDAFERRMNWESNTKSE